ncbi:MAG: zf-HC2 domain-containing protein [Saprospiraceae bacterium]
MKRTDEQKQMLIEKYLEGELSDKEKVLFERHIKETDFSAELRFQKNLKNATKRLAKKENPLKLLFQGEEKKIKEGETDAIPSLPVFEEANTISLAEVSAKKSKNKPFLRIWIPYAASAAVLALVALWMWNPFEGPTPFVPADKSSLIAKFQRPPQMTQITKSGGNDRPLDSIAIDCITLFKTENQYPKALSCFQNLAVRQSTPEIQYYIGQCYLNTDSFEQAIRQYDMLLQQGQLTNPDTLQQIRWNRLLAKAASEQEGYQAELEAMANDKGFKYLKEARDLQELLGQ